MTGVPLSLWSTADQWRHGPLQHTWKDDVTYLENSFSPAQSLRHVYHSPTSIYLLLMRMHLQYDMKYIIHGSTILIDRAIILELCYLKLATFSSIRCGYLSRCKFLLTEVQGKAKILQYVCNIITLNVSFVPGLVVWCYTQIALILYFIF